MKRPHPIVFPALIGWIAIAAVVAVWTRCECIRDELWIDELITAWTVDGTWGEIAEKAKTGNQSPLYFWMLYPIVKLGGLQSLALRSLSMIGGIGFLVGIVWLVYRCTRSMVAVALSLSLAAIDTQFIFYASEARSYGLVQCLGLLQVVWFQRILTGRSPWQASTDDDDVAAEEQPVGWIDGWGGTIGFVALTAMLFYLHYTMVVILLAETSVAIAVTMMAFWEGKRIRRWRWFYCFLASALLCIPGGLHLVELSGRRTQWDLFVSSIGYWRSIRWDLLTYLAVPIAGFVGIAGLSKPASDDVRLFRRVSDGGIVWLAVFGISLLLAIGFTSLAGTPLAHYRYTIAISGVAPVIAGCAIGMVGSVFRQTLLASIVLTLAVLNSQVGANLSQGTLMPPLRYERWGLAAIRLNGNRFADDYPVVLFPNLLEDAALRWDDSPLLRGMCLAPISVQANQFRDRVVMPATMAGDLQFTDDQFAATIERGGVWVLMRSRPEDAARRVNELRLDFKRRHPGYSLRFRWFDLGQSDVQLIRGNILPLARRKTES